MKQNRKTFEPYWGKCVEVTGFYNREYNNIRYDYNEECHTTMPKSAMVENPKTKKRQLFYSFDHSKVAKLKPLLIPIDKGSVIKSISGAKGFEDINEDHIIIQHNINRNGKIPLGSKVKIYGHIGAYKSSSKEDGYDYSIDQVLNITIIDE